jgi:hypothetical protein
MSDLSHLWLENTTQDVPYTHPGGGGGGEFATPPRETVAAGIDQYRKFASLEEKPVAPSVQIQNNAVVNDGGANK